MSTAVKSGFKQKGEIYMKKQTKNVLSIVSMCVGVMFISYGFIALYTTQVKHEQEQERMWRELAEAPVDPGSNVSGIVNVYIFPYQSDPVTYNSSLEGSASTYANFSASGLNADLEGDVPYGERFDIVVCVQFNYSRAYNTTTPGFDSSYVRANLTSPELSIAALTAMDKGNWFDTSGTDHSYIHFYIQDPGFVLSHGVEVNVTELVVQAYY